MEEIDAEIERILQRVLELEQGAATDKLAFNVTPAWDSLAYMTIIAGLEDSFGVMFGMDDILAMKKPADIRRMVHRYLREKRG